MDLRPYNPTPEQIAKATRFACSGQLCYQPFLVADDLQTGAGYEFVTGRELAGLVYCAEPPEIYRNSEGSARFLIDPALKDEFASCNQRLRVMYENLIDETIAKVGPVSDLTMADVGSCSGYFPVSFSKRGAKQAVGYDREDYSGTFRLLNEILGTSAEFRHRGYDGANGGIPDAGEFDVVFSIAVLVHLSDPLQHLAQLGRMAKKAIVVWTAVTQDAEDDLAIRYISQNRYYSKAEFPYCFDVTFISHALLRRSLQAMGFTKLYPMETTLDGMPEGWFNRQRGYIAIR